ncbi:MAG TPA: hypothetical protein VGJ95_21695, partial [Pseudonocardiaceae bacterium]
MKRRRAAPSAAAPAAPAGGTIFARAYVESVTVDERFGYEQWISRNPSIGRRHPPTGHIEISMPYDGHRYFTRDAAKDVAAHLRGHATKGGDLEALIGHLVLVDHQDTDLSEVLALDGRFGAYPLRIPVRTAALNTTDALIADQLEHRVRVDYAHSEDRPELVPIKLTVDLADPDHSDLLTTTEALKLLRREDVSQLEQVANDIKRFIGFMPFLQLNVTVRVTLPARPAAGAQLPVVRPPVVRRVGVRVPTAMSLADSSLELLAGRGTTVQHHPDNWDLEWFDVPMKQTQPTAGRPRSFQSPVMKLLFKQPGELFAHDQLIVEAEVEVPDELLSGTSIRVFDACGKRYPAARDPLTVRSILTSRCTVVLRDAFAERLLSPYQSFHFDEIIPDQLRIADIHAALSDQRFTINEWPLPSATDKRDLRRFLIAERTEGPDTMVLWVFIEGRGHRTRRQA